MSVQGPAGSVEVAHCQSALGPKFVFNGQTTGIDFAVAVSKCRGNSNVNFGLECTQIDDASLLHVEDVDDYYLFGICVRFPRAGCSKHSDVISVVRAGRLAGPRSREGRP